MDVFSDCQLWLSLMSQYLPAVCSFPLFLVIALTIPFEETLLPLSVHIGVAVPSAPPCGTRG